MISKLVEDIASISGIADRDAILTSIDSAAREVWNTFDIPNSLSEESFEVTQQGEISLPYYIQHVRAVKVSCYQPIELNDIRPAYIEDYCNSPWTWRITGRKALMTDITNASILCFKRDESDKTEVTLSIIGETPLAQRSKEDILFTGSKIVTQENYLAVRSLTKSAMTESDIVVYGSDGDVLALIPNYLTDVYHNIIEPFSKCTCAPACGNCFDVLFKPVLAPVTLSSGFVLPEPFDDVLKWKSLEHLYLPRKDEEQRAVIFNQKARDVYKAYCNDYGTGKRFKMNLPSTGHNTMYWGYL